MAKLFKNPDTGEEKTGEQWAAHIGLSKSGWLVRLRRFGADNPRTYETKEKAAERRKKAIMATKGKQGEKRGPVMPYTRRRGKLAKIKVGTWEEKNVPDRWAHLVGEP